MGLGIFLVLCWMHDPDLISTSPSLSQTQWMIQEWHLTQWGQSAYFLGYLCQSCQNRLFTSFGIRTWMDDINWSGWHLSFWVSWNNSFVVRKNESSMQIKAELGDVERNIPQNTFWGYSFSHAWSQSSWNFSQKQVSIMYLFSFRCNLIWIGFTSSANILLIVLVIPIF